MFNTEINEKLINEFNTLSNLKEELSNNPYLKIIYYEEETIMGYLKYSLIYDRIEIEDLYIKEKYRRKQIASKLIDYLINLNLDITLEVNEINISALNLYLKKGFKEVAKRPNYYENQDGLLMERKVMKSER